VAPAPVVAVCPNRSPAAVAEALNSLRAQVPGDQIILVASGLSELQVADHERALAGIRVLTEPRTGLSHARNRALGYASERQVPAIAYVDDDAVIGSGWWEALVARWSRGGERLGVVGGPIRPRWSVPRPAWVSEPIMPALTLLDLGPSERELDPEVTTVFGANISFAVGPLADAGGFDPAFGHTGKRVHFSEEDQAQRALAARGYRVLYAPELAVEHVIPAARLTRRSFVRRRFAYGRALGHRRGRKRSTALRQLSSSGPGAVVALARGDQTLFMERAVRAAENAGVLAGTGRRSRTA